MGYITHRNSRKRAQNIGLAIIEASPFGPSRVELTEEELLPLASALLSAGADPNGKKHNQFKLSGAEYSGMPKQSIFSRAVGRPALCRLLVEHGAHFDNDTVASAIDMINKPNRLRDGEPPEPIDEACHKSLIEMARAPVTANLQEVYDDCARGDMSERRTAISILTSRVPGFAAVLENARLEAATPSAPRPSLPSMRL